jgi:hypothetical protein
MLKPWFSSRKSTKHAIPRRCPAAACSDLESDRSPSR